MTIGTVLFFLGEPKARGSFGFIAPVGGDGTRMANAWFGPRCVKTLEGYTPKAGDVVEYDEAFKPGKGPMALRITKLLDDDGDREKITTLEGCDDVS